MASYCFRPRQARTQPVAGEQYSPKAWGLRLWLEEGASLELRLRLRLRPELELRHCWERGRSEGEQWVLQEPTKRELMAFSSS